MKSNILYQYMCDNKCFWTPNNNDNFLSNFQKDVNAIEKYIIDDITGPTGIINIVRQQVFNISSFGTGLKAGMKAGLEVKQNYLQYIIKYGVPADGIFDPELLAEF